MNKIELTLETVTPLFLSGADARGAPELRPPAFRGAMRYWLRAALGGVIGDHDLRRLHELESAVFGAADEKIGASAVALRLGAQSLTSMRYSDLAQYDANKKTYGRPGLAYLFFAARGTQRDKERSGLVGNFELSVKARAGTHNASLHFEQAYVSLWMLMNLGGLGSRARRGAGNMRVVKTISDAEITTRLPLAIHSNTPQELATELGSRIKQCLDIFGQAQRHREMRDPSAFDVLHPEVCKIWVVNKPFKGWEQALDEIGKAYQGFRKQRAEDYQTVKTAMTGRSSTLARPIERAGLGLPIQFYYRSLNGATAGLEGSAHDRRASPLMMRVIRLANGECAIVLLWFHSIFLPSGEKLKLENKQVHALGDTPDDKLAELFITQPDPINHSSLKDKGLSVLEVSYV